MDLVTQIILATNNKMEVLEEQKVHHLNNHLIHLKEMIVLETLVAVLEVLEAASEEVHLLEAEWEALVVAEWDLVALDKKLNNQYIY